MNGRVSPYRNVKQDVASAIISAGLLGHYGSELLKENSGLQPIPNKKKAVLPELTTQKKPKPPPEDSTIDVAKSPSLGEIRKKKLSDIPTTPQPPENNHTTDNNHFTNNINPDIDIQEEDLRTSSPDLTYPSISPRESPSTPLFPDSLHPTTTTHQSPSPSPTPKIPGFGASKKPKLPKQENLQQVEIPPTKIPEKYHVADQFPIRPHPFEEGETLAFSGQGWQKKWFPSDRPQGRREVLQLIRTFEVMLDDLAAPPQPNQASAAPPLSDIEKEQTIYDTILHEIIRQVTVECADRGVLLEKVSRRYRRLFARVPLILSEMQQEIDGLADANKSLRLLLERLMETKSEAEAQVKETRNKIIETEEINAGYVAEIAQNKATIEKLIKERDDASEEAKRQVERHYYQEKVNSELLSKDEYNKATIRSMGKQLEDALNSLHDMEAKYLALKTQQQAEMKKVVKQATLEFDEKFKNLSATLQKEKSEIEIKDAPATEEEEGGEEEEEREGTTPSRPSTVDIFKDRKKKSKLAKSATYDAASQKVKTKSKDKEKGKEIEVDVSQPPTRAKTPTKTTKVTSPKPTSPSMKLRSSVRMSGRSLLPEGTDPAPENEQ